MTNFAILKEEKFVRIRDSVEKAKEAVSQDTNDGMSWYVLGTAYLNLFFISNQKWVEPRRSTIAVWFEYKFMVDKAD